MTSTSLAPTVADVGLVHPRVRLRSVPTLERNPVTGKLSRFIPLA